MNKNLRYGITVLALGGFGALVYTSYAKDNQQATLPIAGAAPTGRAIVEVTVPELQGKALLGQAAYNAKCAACHGGNAVGQVGVAPAAGPQNI